MRFNIQSSLFATMAVLVGFAAATPIGYKAEDITVILPCCPTDQSSADHPDSWSGTTTARNQRHRRFHLAYSKLTNITESLARREILWEDLRRVW